MAAYTITDIETGIAYPSNGIESMFADMKHTCKSPIPYGCEGGGCGICKVQITDGKFEVFKKMSRRHVSEEEEKQGIVLACCIKAASDISFKKY